MTRIAVGQTWCGRRERKSLGWRNVWVTRVDTENGRVFYRDVYGAGIYGVERQCTSRSFRTQFIPLMI